MPPHFVECFFDGRVTACGEGFAGLRQALGAKLGGVHLAATLDKVVGLVHQQRHAPLVGLGQAMQQPAHVEVVVVVAHHHVGPAGQLLAEVIRAHLVRQRHIAHLRLVQGDQAVTAAAIDAPAGASGVAYASACVVGLQRCRTCGWQPVVKALRQRA